MAANVSHEGLRGGLNRVIDEADESWNACVGDYAEYSWDKEVDIHECRLVFDSDLNRPEKNIVVLNLLKPQLCTTPTTLVKRFKLDALVNGVWQEIGIFENKGQRLVKLPLDVRCRSIRMTLLETFGDARVKIFAWTVD